MLRRMALVVVVGGVAVLALGLGGGSSTSEVRATLNGDKEVGDGDPNGRGTFTGEFEGSRICYRLRFTGLDNPMAAHIHRGASTANGAVVVDLKPRFNSAGAQDRCVSVPAALRRSIRSKPSNFYVNVHTEAFADGAIRGQLARKR